MGRWAGRRDFFSLPSLSPASMLNPSTSPLKSVIDSPQLSGSINVQDGGIALFPPPAPPPPPKKNGSRCEIRLLYRLVVINILFILMVFSLNYLLKMLGENRCWSPLELCWLFSFIPGVVHSSSFSSKNAILYVMFFFYRWCIINCCDNCSCF